MAKEKVVRPAKKTVQAKPPFPIDKVIMWAHIIAITVLFAFVYSQIFDSKPDMNGDNFAYFLLGQRIAHGLGFTNATDIHHGPHIHFSPGYPYLLAFFMRIFGEDQDTIDIMNGLMMYGSLLLLYFLVKKLVHNAHLAFAAAFITALNPHLLRSATITMSEVPFLFFSLLAILFFILAKEDNNDLKSPWLYLSIIMMGACYYTKTTSIALAAGACLYLLFDKDWKRLLTVGIGFVAIMVPGYLRSKKYGSSYLGQFMQISPYKPELGNLTQATFIERITHNFSRYVSNDIPSSIMYIESNAEKAPLSYWLLGILLIALISWGIYRLKNFRLFFFGYILGTMAILLIWPDVWGGIRFVLPLVPLVVFFALYGIQELIGYVTRAAAVPYVFMLFGLLYVKPINGLEEQAQQSMPANYTNYFEIAKWAKTHTPKDAIFSARKADMFIYYSDRTCIGDKPSLDDKEVLDFFRKNNVDYVVVEQLGFSSTSKYLIPAIQKNPDKFEVILQLPNPDTYLLKFKR